MLGLQRSGGVPCLGRPAQLQCVFDGTPWRRAGGSGTGGVAGGAKKEATGKGGGVHVAGGAGGAGGLTRPRRLELETDELSHFFSSIDADGSETVSLAELEKALASAYRPGVAEGSPAEGSVEAEMLRTVRGTTVARLFARIDADRSGTVEVEELLAELRRRRIVRGARGEVEVQALFNSFDADGNGTIKYDELYRRLNSKAFKRMHTPPSAASTSPASTAPPTPVAVVSPLLRWQRGHTLPARVGPVFIPSRGGLLRPRSATDASWVVER